MKIIFIIFKKVLIWSVSITLLMVAIDWWWRPSVERGNVQSLKWYLTKQLQDAQKNKRLGSAALVLIHQGEIVEESSYDVVPQNDSTRREEKLYLLCSVSKAVSTWGVMKLIEDGKLRLDEPILPHLKRWKFPGSEPFSNQVTVRHLLSHTSGLVDGFGFSGFLLEDKRQTLEESLQFPKDANMGDPHPAIIQYPPGSRMSYSSVGYTILQLLIEDMTNRPFNEYMKEQVLQPLGIKYASYDTEELASQGRLNELAPNYDRELKTHPHRKHTMMAGGSLRITPHEMALFLQAYFQEKLLTKSTIQLMLQPQPATASSWALGHEIYLDTASTTIVGHGGGAFPRTGASFRVNTSTGNAIAIMMTGGTEMIDPYMNAWIYWETGHYNFDIREVFQRRIQHIAMITILGAVLITAWHLRRGKRATI